MLLCNILLYAVVLPQKQGFYEPSADAVRYVFSSTLV